MTTTRARNNLSRESIVALQNTQAIFNSPEFIIGGGITMIVAPSFVFTQEDEQVMAIISTVFGIILVTTGATLKIVGRYYLSQPHPIPAQRNILPDEPSSVAPRQKDTSPPTSSTGSHPKEKRGQPVSRKVRFYQQNRQKKKQKTLQSRANWRNYWPIRMLQSQANYWWTISKEGISTLVKKYRSTSQSVKPSQPPSSTQRSSSVVIVEGISDSTTESKTIAPSVPAVALQKTLPKSKHKGTGSPQLASNQSKQKIKKKPAVTPTRVTALNSALSTQQNNFSITRNQPPVSQEPCAIVSIDSISDSKTESNTSFAATSDHAVASQKKQSEPTQKHTDHDQRLENFPSPKETTFGTNDSKNTHLSSLSQEKSSLQLLDPTERKELRKNMNPKKSQEDEKTHHKNNSSKNSRKIPSSQRSSSVVIIHSTSEPESNASLTVTSDHVIASSQKTLPESTQEHTDHNQLLKNSPPEETKSAISNSSPQLLDLTKNEKMTRNTERALTFISVTAPDEKKFELTSTSVTTLGNISFTQVASGQSEQKPTLASTPTASNSTPSTELAPGEHRKWRLFLAMEQKQKLIIEENKQLQKQLTEERNQTHYYYNLSTVLASDIMNGVCYPYYYFFPPVVVPPEPIVVAETHACASFSENGKGKK